VYVSLTLFFSAFFIFALFQMFSDTLSPHSQLITPAPLPASASTYLAMGLFARGPSIHISDIARNVARLKQQVTLARWNPDGFKIGLCSVPPVGVQRSVLALSNNTCIAGTFEAMRDRFHRLYRRRAHVHHYTEYIEAAAFDDAAEGLEELIGDYRGAETLAPSGDARMRPLV
jgi:tubulin epsilon